MIRTKSTDFRKLAASLLASQSGLPTRTESIPRCFAHTVTPAVLDTVWEGGVRVPAAVRWPGAWRGGRKVTEPLAYVDLLPTLARIAGANSLPEDLDGKDVFDVLTGEQANLKRTIYLGPQTLVGTRWKLVDEELFAIATDPGETKNVAQDHPAVVQSLKRELAGLK